MTKKVEISDKSHDILKTISAKRKVPQVHLLNQWIEQNMAMEDRIRVILDIPTALTKQDMEKWLNQRVAVVLNKFFPG